MEEQQRAPGRQGAKNNKQRYFGQTVHEKVKEYKKNPHKSRRFTNQMLADVAGVRKVTFEKWITGQTRPPLYIMLILSYLMHEVKLSPYDFLTDEERTIVETAKKQIRGLRGMPRHRESLRQKLAGRL